MPGLATVEEVKEAYQKEGFSILKPDDVARTIVWLLSEDSFPVYGAHINVGAALPWAGTYILEYVAGTNHVLE
jgi:chanoclavine-I dehydrogenase